MSVPPERPDRHGDDPLTEALASSQRLGFLGRAPTSDVITHSEAFVEALAGVSGTVVDLGSGGGVPGLVIAWRRPDLRLVLVDRRATRTDHLQRLVRRMGLEDQVNVVTVDAVLLPRQLDAPVDAVVARSFGRPESVLQAAVPILVDGGLIVASEPPDTRSGARWAPELLDRFGVQRLESDLRLAVLRLRFT